MRIQTSPWTGIGSKKLPPTRSHRARTPRPVSRWCASGSTSSRSNRMPRTPGLPATMEATSEPAPAPMSTTDGPSFSLCAARGRRAHPARRRSPPHPRDAAAVRIDLHPGDGPDGLAVVVLVPGDEPRLAAKLADLCPSGPGETNRVPRKSATFRRARSEWIAIAARKTRQAATARLHCGGGGDRSARHGLCSGCDGRSHEGARPATSSAQPERSPFRPVPYWPEPSSQPDARSPVVGPSAQIRRPGQLCRQDRPMFRGRSPWRSLVRVGRSR